MPGLQRGIEPVTFQYATKGDVNGIPDAPADKQIGLNNFAAYNNSGAPASVGILRKLSLATTKIYKLVSGVYTLLDNADIAAGLEVHSGAANDGFAVGSIMRTGMLGIGISTTATGGDFTGQYSNDGATFSALPSGALVEAPADYSAGGNNYHVMQSPLDAQAGGPAGLDQSLFYVQVISTGILSGPVEINNLYAASFLTLWKFIADGNPAQVSFDWNRPLMLNGDENIIPYFASPSDDNRVSSFYSLNG